MDYIYKLTSENENGKTCIETNKVRDAIGCFFVEADKGGLVELTSNLTGEVLMAVTPNGEPYTDDEFDLTLLGYFAEEDLRSGEMPFSDCTAPVTIPY